MSQEKGPFTLLKKLLQPKEDGNQKISKRHYLLIVLVVGIAIMLFANYIANQSKQSSNPVAVTSNNSENEEVETFGKNSGSQPTTMREYEEYYENQLKEVIESAAGVSDVSIVVNVDSTEQKIYEKNTVNKNQVTSETDANGGKREVEDKSTEEQIVIVREGDQEVPLVSETKKPDIRGVLIVAKGADNIEVKKSIIEAIMRTLDVPSHRISVMAKE